MEKGKIDSFLAEQKQLLPLQDPISHKGQAYVLAHCSERVTNWQAVGHMGFTVNHAKKSCGYERQFQDCPDAPVNVVTGQISKDLAEAWAHVCHITNSDQLLS